MLLARLLEVRIPERFYSALLALAAAVIVVAGAWIIESYRLRDALSVQAVYQQRFDRTQEQLRAANVYNDRVRAVVALDRRVRGIAASGDADARTLAEIANRLPQHAWLTAISHDETGLTLEGRAKNLAVLGGVIHELMRAKHLHSPTLVSAIAEKPQGEDAAMKYEIHVDGAAQ